MKVYALWKGSYEDRDCHGIYSTLEEAREAVDAHIQDLLAGTVEIIQYEIGEFYEMNETVLWHNKIDYDKQEDGSYTHYLVDEDSEE